MFEPNVLENRPIDPNGFDPNQKAIAPPSLLGLDTTPTQPTQLLGSEDISQYVQDTLETQFLKDEESFTPSPEAEMVNNSFKGLFRSVSSDLRYHHSNFQDKLNSLIEDYSSNPQDKDELTGISANVSTQSVNPDLIVSNFSVSNTLEAGQSVWMNYTITNQGNGNADSSNYTSASTTKFYLSTDTTLDATDTYLTGKSTSDWYLAAGQSRSSYAYFTLDSNFASGTYYLLAQADGEQVMVESDESNNITYQQVTVLGETQPDLVISSLSSANTVEAGQTLWVNYTISNQGDGAVDFYGPSTYTSFYLSTDTTFDATDTYLDLDANLNSRLSAGASDDTFAVVGFDENLTPGDYYLLAKADGFNSISESNENNNLAYQQITVTGQKLADLAISDSDINAPDSFTLGDYGEFSYTIHNYGNTTIADTLIGVRAYLSSDETLDSSDYEFAINYAISPIEVDGSLTLSSEFYLDFGNVVPGSYTLFMVVDGYDSIEEWDETNNIASVTIDIAPSVDGYSINSGYGLINAAAAVAEAINQPTFAEVPDLGGNYWGAELINAPEVWNAGYTGEGVVVAVLDTGVDRHHEDLTDNIWTNVGEIANNGIDDDGNGYIDDVYGWNSIDGNNNTLDLDGHGTHVAGTIAALKNDFGVTGMAYNAEIMPVKVLGDDGGTTESLTEGIRYAVDNGANVINMSLGYGAVDSIVYKDELEADLRPVLEYASNNGVIVVMSAGNDMWDWVNNYPSTLAHTWGLAVGAVDYNNEMASFSNRSGDDNLAHVERTAYVTAPGVAVLSTTPNNTYDSYQGTSMAAPHVAGVVALMLEANPNLTDAQVRQIVTGTAQNTQYT
ncbi:MAG: S8 family serine peptidase [Crocosphaera sp.]